MLCFWFQVGALSLGFVLLLFVIHSSAQEEYSGNQSGQVKKTLKNVSQMCGDLTKACQMSLWLKPKSILFTFSCQNFCNTPVLQSECKDCMQFSSISLFREAKFCLSVSFFFCTWCG